MQLATSQLATSQTQLPLMRHQVHVGELCAKFPRYGYWLDCGTGKTIAMLAMLHVSKAASRVAALRASLTTAGFDPSPTTRMATVDGVVNVPAAPYHKTLVVCPKAIMRNAWARDAKHFPDLNLVVCWADTPVKRRDLIRTTGADVLVINPECFKKHTDDFYAVGVRRLIVDESSIMKNHTSQISKDAIDFSDRMASVYLLSGTPAPNYDVEYWPQMRAIDKRVFGESFYRFEAEYFTPISRDVHAGQGRVKRVTVGWKAKPDKRDRFINRLNARSWSLRKEQCVDLPEQLDVVRTVDLSPAEVRAYADAETELRVEAEGQSFNVKTETLVNKLRQLCGGWMYTSPGVAARIGRAKLDATNELLDELGNKPVVIWADFREDVHAIAELLKDRDETHRVLAGGGDDSTEAVSAFQDGRVQRLVCHPGSVGHGVTLTASNYAIFYTIPWSYELYQQARDRIHRTGQRNVCTYFHLMVENSIDQVVYWSVKRKKGRSEGLMKLLSMVEQGVTI